MKKIHLIYLITIVFLIFSFACKKENEFTEHDYPLIKTEEVEIITDTGIVANATILKQGTGVIIDHGFVWSENSKPTIEKSKFSLGADMKNEGFFANITFSMVSKTNYYLRAYTITENFVNYGTEVIFMSNNSLPPIISDFNPKFGGDRTEVIITGKVFSNNKDDIILRFGEEIIEIDNSTNKEIFFRTPILSDTGSFSISIEMYGEIIYTSEDFKVFAPEITSITPSPAWVFENITILGNYFNSNASENIVTIGNETINIVSCSENEIIATIPNMQIGEQNLTLQVGGKSSTTLISIISNWTSKNAFGGTSRRGAVGFSIGNKGYIGTGWDTYYLQDFWEYNSETDTWTQKEDFANRVNSNAVGFSIGNKGYIGTGYDSNHNKKNDFWEYNPDSDTWTQKADFGGSKRVGAVGFSIGNKGYIGTGLGNGLEINFWEYNPETNKWTQKTNFGGSKRYSAVGFSIGNKGYIGTGLGNVYKSDFWEYNPETEIWTQKKDFAGAARAEAVGFSIDNKGYIGTGNSGVIEKDFWEYSPETDTWTQKADFGGTARNNAVGFSIGSKGYLGTGLDINNELKNNFWEYDPNPE